MTADRARARAVRSAAPETTRVAWSRAITEHVVGWDRFVRAKSVMAYASIGSEVDTWPLLAATIGMGKRLLLPRCLGGGVMEAVPVMSLDMLAPGASGILEPARSAPAGNKRSIDLILVPGLLFDGRGNRLGQGAGYYDRFLWDFSGMTCALAFGIQLVEALETMPHDVPVKALATEAGVRRCGAGNGE